ncbi:hypothetical protein [Massilia sp. CCM 8734]|uniref:hypothetical protein n=1 Tax=Massilia sp. CCM 8734 TaxID=2609283 RepID=UPI001422B3E1|nr:hypothetical protein [Massilia sp. CCM 8734]NIA00089.1 hypothetical protein [Massilia sp. CCM 8734]
MNTTRNAAVQTAGAGTLRTVISEPSVPTMSSIELVELINSVRDLGRAELRHDNFMVKIEKHPGIDSPKFLGQYKDSTGRSLKCYYLPKREAELMVMSESLEVQTKVYDRLARLEASVADPMASLSPEHRALVALLFESSAIKAQQAAHAAELAAQAESIKRIEANQIAAVASVQSFTALGYSLFRDLGLSKIELGKLGRKATALSRARGITIDQVGDGRYGRVGSYHISVLDDALVEISK